ANVVVAAVTASILKWLYIEEWPTRCSSRSLRSLGHPVFRAFLRMASPCLRNRRSIPAAA
ncbi:MAG: hypothetical protein ABIP04_01265, partial [Sulfuriferula sp.]